MIAQSFFLIKYVEQFGTGIQRILDDCHAKRSPEPTFEVHGQNFRAIFKPVKESKATSDTTATQVTPQVTAPDTAQVGTKSALSRHQVDILSRCVTESTLLQLMSVVGNRIAPSSETKL